MKIQAKAIPIGQATPAGPHTVKIFLGKEDYRLRYTGSKSECERIANKINDFQESYDLLDFKLTRLKFRMEGLEK